MCQVSRSWGPQGLHLQLQLHSYGSLCFCQTQERSGSISFPMRGSQAGGDKMLLTLEEQKQKAKLEST